MLFLDKMIDTTEGETNSLIEDSTIEVKQRIKRIEILSSIATNGLMSSKDLMRKGVRVLHSVDSVIEERDLRGVFVACEGMENVFVDTDWRETYTGSGKRLRSIHYLWRDISGRENDVTVEQSDKEVDLSIEDVFIQRTLYDDVSSVFPVLMERGIERNAETRKLLKSVMEDRTLNSILVVTPLTKVGFDTLDSWEVFVNSTIQSGNFIAVLSPRDLLVDTREAFIGTPGLVRGVGIKEAEVFTAKTYGIHGQAAKIQVPDYESEIRSLLAESKKPLFIHGVRLPTKDDILTEARQ